MRGVGASAKTLLNISDQFICIEDLAAIPVGVNNCGPLDRDNYSGPIDPLRQKAPEHRRGNRNIAKIEVNGNAAVQPLLRQAFLDRGSKKNSLAYTPPQRDGIKEPLTRRFLLFYSVIQRSSGTGYVWRTCLGPLFFSSESNATVGVQSLQVIRKRPSSAWCKRTVVQCSYQPAKRPGIFALLRSLPPQRQKGSLVSATSSVRKRGKPGR